jgi:transposase
MFLSQEIEIKNINHLGLVAGIVDDIGLEKIINEVVGYDKRELITSGQVVKGIILNGLGFTSQPLYLFPKFFEDKATEFLLGDGSKAEYLNDDKIGRVMDKLYEKGLSSIFLMIALAVVEKYQLLTNFSHLDSSSFSVHGKYLINNLISSKQEEKKSEEPAPAPITITKGYSRDHRPDLKQFIIDLIVSGDGGIPLFLRVADGNEQDKVVFGDIAVEYQSMIDFDTIIVADSALYSAKNLQLMSSIKWLSRVPLSLGKAKQLVNNVLKKELNQSSIEGYSWKEQVITYGEIKQRWLLVESQKRKESDLRKLSERMDKEKEKASQDLKSLVKEKFTSPEVAVEVAHRFSKSLKYHQLAEIQIQEIEEKKNKKKPVQKSYQMITTLEINQDKVNELKTRAGRFILATNELEETYLSSDDILIKYKEQQAAERGFGFLKDPLFFADSVFLKSPKRVETMAMLMGLCLLVYSLGQRELRRRLFEAKTGLKNQLGKLTEKPTLRWIFQGFQGIHLLLLSGVKQIVNLTEERQLILSFFPTSSQKYYILSG